MGYGYGAGHGGYGRGYGYGAGRAIGQGSGGFSCVKFSFFIFNVIFWLLGCAILGIGIWLHISKGNYASVAPSFQFLSATALCIAAGIIVLVVGFFGCCGAIMENQCMLLTYFLLVVLIFVLEIVAGVLAFVYRHEVSTFIGQELSLGIQEKYMSADEPFLTAAWNQTQSDLSCCGIHNASDWYTIAAWPQRRWVPQSCCTMQYVNCHLSENPDDWHKKGCLEEIQSIFKQNLYLLGIVAITIGMIQIFGLIAAMALFCCLRNGKYYN